MDATKNKNKPQNKKISQTEKKSPVISEYSTYALTGGKQIPESGTTVPSEESVISAKQFVEGNKK